MFISNGPSKKWLEHYKKIVMAVKRPDVEAIVVGMSKSPPDFFSDLNIVLDGDYYITSQAYMGELLNTIRKADKEGFDGAIIGCFWDPGLREAKEIANMPVTGVAEASLHVAATLGHKFSIVTMRRKVIPVMEDNVTIYSLEKKLASIRGLGFSLEGGGALDTSEEEIKEKRLVEALMRESKRAIEEDGAEVIILGDTIESGYADVLMKKLRVPIIDPVAVGWKYIELLADLYHNYGISQSKIGDYESPPEINSKKGLTAS